MGRKLKIILWAVLAGLSLTTGCRPEGIIPPEDMVTLFSEFYLADAYIETANDHSSEIVRHIDSLRVYLPLIEQQGYTKETFRASVEYYLHRPDELDGIFDQVHARLEEQRAAAEKAEQEALIRAEIEEEVEEEAGEEAGTETKEAVREGVEPEIEKDERPKFREPAGPAEPRAPAVDSQTGPARKNIRKKVTRKDLKRLEEELK